LNCCLQPAVRFPAMSRVKMYADPLAVAAPFCPSVLAPTTTVSPSSATLMPKKWFIWLFPVPSEGSSLTISVQVAVRLPGTSRVYRYADPLDWPLSSSSGAPIIIVSPSIATAEPKRSKSLGSKASSLTICETLKDKEFRA